MAAFKVLVLCTGNRFRSPLLAHFLRQARPQWSIRSAGTRVSQPNADAPQSWHRCESTWIDQHAARKITMDDIEWADVIIGVQKSHKQEKAKRMIIYPFPDPAFCKVTTWPELAQQLQAASNHILALIEQENM